MIPHREDGGSAYRQHDGSHLLNKHSLFPYVLPAPPIPPLHNLIALITSDEEHIKYYEGFVNKKTKNKWKDLEICVKWTGAKSHSTESWYLKRQTARLSSQTTTRLLPAGETGSSPSEPSSTHAKTRPMRCEKALWHQEWCKGRWIFEEVTMALPEFYIVVDVSVEHNYIFIPYHTIP